LLSWYSFCLLDHPAAALHPLAAEARLDRRIQTCAGIGFPNRGQRMRFSVDKHDTELIGFEPTSRISS
jgi:hypothetical protein